MPSDSQQPDAPPGSAPCSCSACGQVIQRNIKPMYWSADLVYRTITGHINARCPDCKYNMRHQKVKGGRVYECVKCHQWWRLET